MTCSLGKENWSLGMSSIVNMKQVKVLCLNYILTWEQRLSNLCVCPLLFCKCANIYTDPCDAFECFMIVPKFLTAKRIIMISTVISLWLL